MMFEKVPQDARLEIKFVDRSHHFDQTLQWIKLHSAGFYQAFPDRQINNIYFDTHDYRAFVENLSGGNNRSKLRYRWYGASLSPTEGVLEVKKKRNCYGWKKQIKITTRPYEDGMSWREIKKNITSQVPVADHCLIAFNSSPVIINRYHRKYFVSRDGKIRVTLDTNQKIWDQRYKAFPNIKKETKIPDTIVVEFKFNRQDSLIASKTIQGLPLRISRNSKYVNGLIAVTDY